MVDAMQKGSSWVVRCYPGPISIGDLIVDPGE